jgi:hypothetical protein
MCKRICAPVCGACAAAGSGCAGCVRSCFGGCAHCFKRFWCCFCGTLRDMFVWELIAWLIKPVIVLLFLYLLLMYGLYTLYPPYVPAEQDDSTTQYLRVRIANESSSAHIVENGS